MKSEENNIHPALSEDRISDLRKGGIHRVLRQVLEIEKSFGLSEVPTGASMTRGKKQALGDLENEFKKCMMCGLSEGRTQVVFGSGNPDAELMFVGEAPGFDEDRQGQPFVGLAGQLLTKIIQAMKLKRENVYIANCLKCRPQSNRSPLPSEIATCKPILMKQIEIIRPTVICALGKFAAQTLLQTDEPISRLRGRFFDGSTLLAINPELSRGIDCARIKVMPTFHPAYLLRNPADKKLVWADVRLIMKELGINP